MKKKNGCSTAKKKHPSAAHKPRFLFYFKTAHCAISVQS